MRAPIAVLAGLLVGGAAPWLVAADAGANGSATGALSPFVIGGGNSAPVSGANQTGGNISPAVNDVQVRALRAKLDSMSPSDPDYARTLNALENALGMRVNGNTNSFGGSAGPALISTGGTVFRGGLSTGPLAVPSFTMSTAGTTEVKKSIIAAPPFEPVTIAAPMSFSLTVGGAMDPWLAGMPPGAHTKNANSVPENSPVFVGRVTPGQVVTFAATNKAANIDATIQGSTKHAAENGLAGVEAPFHSLVGVFLNDQSPDAEPAPDDFPAQPEDQTLRPGLRQIFLIGDGRTSSGGVRQFVVPPGATRLFLGATNSNGLSEQFGRFEVQVQVPRQPAKLLLWLIGGFFALMVISILGMALRHRPCAAESDEEAETARFWRQPPAPED